MSEPLMRLLNDLPTGQPDPERAEQIRLRCRQRLARHATRQIPAAVRNTNVWQPLIAALGVVYLIAAIAQAFAVLSSQF